MLQKGCRHWKEETWGNSTDEQNRKPASSQRESFPFRKLCPRLTLPLVKPSPSCRVLTSWRDFEFSPSSPFWEQWLPSATPLSLDKTRHRCEWPSCSGKCFLAHTSHGLHCPALWVARLILTVCFLADRWHMEDTQNRALDLKELNYG